MYKCVDCGHLFEQGEEAVWSESRGEFWGSPCSEEVSGCPICKGGYEEVTPCEKCETYCFSDELTDGMCDNCILDAITYQNALEYFEQFGELHNFIFNSVWKMDAPAKVSDELNRDLREFYLRYVADAQIRNSNDFINLICDYIISKSCRKSAFVEILKERE